MNESVEDATTPTIPTELPDLLEEYESTSRMIVGLMKRRFEIKNAIDIMIDSARMREEKIDAKFREHVPAETVPK